MARAMNQVVFEPLQHAQSWTLPVYELAIMAATELRNRGREPEITVASDSRSTWVPLSKDPRMRTLVAPSVDGTKLCPVSTIWVPGRISAGSTRVSASPSRPVSRGPTISGAQPARSSISSHGFMAAR